MAECKDSKFTGGYENSFDLNISCTRKGDMSYNNSTDIASNVLQEMDPFTGVTTLRKMQNEEPPPVHSSPSASALCNISNNAE